MKQRLLILVNANWPTLPAKVNDLKAMFFPEIDLSIDAQEAHFATIPFKDYGAGSVFPHLPAIIALCYSAVVRRSEIVAGKALSAAVRTWGHLRVVFILIHGINDWLITTFLASLPCGEPVGSRAVKTFDISRRIVLTVKGDR
jgi:hypothetical protein